MAQKRMISNKVIDTDIFLDMPPTAQNLYFHLNMKADDEGFLSNCKTIMRTIRASIDDLLVLKSKNFIIDFENGVIVIRHWRMNNILRADRLKETQYIEEKLQLTTTKSGLYNKCQPDDNQVSAQISIDKTRLDKTSIEKNKEKKPQKHKHGEYKNVLLSDEELEKLKTRFVDYEKRIKQLDEGVELKGYKYKSHYLAIIKWAEKDKPQIEAKQFKFNKEIV